MLKPGDLVLVRKLPKYYGSIDIAPGDVRGKWGTVLCQGSHDERWIVLVEDRRLSLHRNHVLIPEEVDAEAR